MKSLLAALLATFALGSQAAETDGVLTFERAESPGYSQPLLPDEARVPLWTTVALPHNWYADPPPANRAWYRLRFTLDEVPYRSESLYLARLSVSDLAVYVNQREIWRLGENYALGAPLTAVLIPIPPGVLREGENVIDLEVEGDARWYHGVPRVHFGDTKLLAKRAGMRRLFQGQVIYFFAAAFGVVGLLALWLWLRGGRDAMLFWYAMSGLTLVLATALWYLTLWQDEAGGARLALIFLRFNGYLMPLLILHLRLAQRRHPWPEGVLWAAFALAVGSIAIEGPWQWLAWSAWGILFAALPALFVIPLLQSRALRRQPAVLLLLLADVVAALLNLHDWALRLGWIDFDRPYFIYFVPPFVMLAAAVPILERLMAGLTATRRMNVELEQRVAAKAREIEAGQARLQQAQREKALAEERRRIMADMHDGLGARLVSLLSVAQSGKARPEELREGIAAALDDLRLTVDSVQSVEGDVGVVLGNVRHRMRSVFERAGVRFLWNVSALPRMDDLTPERILAIQRIFLEVFSNALKHAGARSVAVSAMRVPGAVQIVIADDGRGFDAGAVRPGNGLANLQLRARQAGGTLLVESDAGKGTRVTLALPLGEAEPPDLPRTGEKEAQYPVSGMSPEPSRA
ncbi:MAG TPA: ATP-binding protein [Burkholderiales bacterium]|nr:ATP-binding protein [Burkholderiales bacterium]